MKTRCNTCGKINEVKDEDELCFNCGGELQTVLETYGLGEERPETLKRYEDLEGGDII